MVQTGRRRTEKEKTLLGSREGVVQDGQGTGGGDGGAQQRVGRGAERSTLEVGPLGSFCS